ncbi:MAG: ATP-dependent RNA helicase DbpA [Ignavibacteriaceae bacterium]|nr:ATP-dependent RNA helicase DbpA [Ignavibacteriaceae bacterium]
MTRPEAQLLLKQRFGIPSFYDRQWEAVSRVLKGERVLLIEKTGFGKSLCFQFPATVFCGTTVIFSPLIALMRDQVKKLSSLGISARCINSEQTEEENTDIIREVKEGKIKILYIAPERQENSEWIEAAVNMNLSMVVVDEAHCISVWGHDFRPAFRRIINLVKLLPPGLPVLAVTATATKRVEKDIAEQIGGNLTILRGNLLRDNFKLFVVPVSSDDEKMIWLGKNIEKMPGTGIIYTGTRTDTDLYTKWLERCGVSVRGYNAGLDAESRVEIENGLMSNRWKCIVSTNALGMGIDKPDIRFIIHTQMPQSPVHYYQEIGRAGRDGETSYIMLFHGPDDRRLPESFIENARPSVQKYQKVIHALEQEMLTETDILRKVNLKLNQIRVIKADLIDQGIIREVQFGKQKMYELTGKSTKIDTTSFDELRKTKMQDLDQMTAYIQTGESRMKFLCDYLGDSYDHNYTNCDNTGERKVRVQVTPEWTEKLADFKMNCFPIIEIELKTSNLVSGVAASFYGFSQVGSVLHRCKYEQGGEFPGFLVEMFTRAVKQQFAGTRFDLILYVPPSNHGDLVKSFAVRAGSALRIPVYHELVKTRVTQQQKIFESAKLKSENVKDAFTLIAPGLVKGKKILLIDDIYDSGATVKEIGKMLTRQGAELIAPAVIAKTVGGDTL